MQNSVTDPVALVTGGASGIGRAVVDDLVGHGYRVVVLDRVPPAGPLPAGATVVIGDVRVFADNVQAVQTAVEQYGRLDVLVANAGIHDGGIGIRDLPGADLAQHLRQVLDVDVVGYLLAARAATESLLASNGSMIFTLSDASFLVSGNGAGLAYATAKHAALGLVRHLAADLAPAVRVNAIAPGGVVTGLRAPVSGGADRAVYERPEEIRKIIEQYNPLGLVLTPAQIAPLYRFLASPHAAGMTGEVLRPDGGLGVR